jgi:hypothetical protein
MPKNVSWQTDMWTALTNFAQGTTLKTDDSQEGSSAIISRTKTRGPMPESTLGMTEIAYAPDFTRADASSQHSEGPLGECSRGKGNDQCLGPSFFIGTPSIVRSPTTGALLASADLFDHGPSSDCRPNFFVAHRCEYNNLLMPPARPTELQLTQMNCVSDRVTQPQRGSGSATRLYFARWIMAQRGNSEAGCSGITGPVSLRTKALFISWALRTTATERWPSQRALTTA